jgi:hypothetical protein
MRPPIPENFLKIVPKCKTEFFTPDLTTLLSAETANESSGDKTPLIPSLPCFEKDDGNNREKSPPLKSPL